MPRRPSPDLRPDELDDHWAFQDQQTDSASSPRRSGWHRRRATRSNGWSAPTTRTKKGKIDQFIGSMDLATGNRSASALDDLATALSIPSIRRSPASRTSTWHVTDRFDITAAAAWRRTSSRLTRSQLAIRSRRDQRLHHQVRRERLHLLGVAAVRDQRRRLRSMRGSRRAIVPAGRTSFRRFTADCPASRSIRTRSPATRSA